MKLRSYPEYRDSGLPWLGEIPAHWDLLRTKYVVREVDERSTTGKETHLSMSQKYGLVESSRIDEWRLQSESHIGGKLCKTNDLVLNRLKAHLGVFAHAPVDGIVSPDYTVLRVVQDSEVRFFESVFKTPTYIGELRRRTKGIVEGFWRLYTDDLYDIRVPVPPAEEQKAVLNWINTFDHKAGRLIRTKQQLIELLNEQKQAIIHRAVTRGLDPDTPTKPTDLDWLPEVPEYWEVKALKQVAAVRLSGVDKHSVEGEQSVLLCNYTDVYNNDFIDSEIDFMPATATEAEIEAFTLEAGDVLVTKDSEAADDIAVPALVREDLNEVLCGYHLALVRPVASSITGEYLFRVLSEVSTSRQFHIAATGVTRFGISKQDIKNALIPLPPLDEQNAVCRWIVDEVRTVDAAIERARREITLIREYRTRLVSDVVTGKLDVREVELDADDEDAGISLDGLESVVTEELPDIEEAINADL